MTSGFAPPPPGHTNLHRLSFPLLFAVTCLWVAAKFLNDSHPPPPPAPKNKYLRSMLYTLVQAKGVVRGLKKVCVPKINLQCPAPSMDFIFFRKNFLMWVGAWVGGSGGGAQAVILPPTPTGTVSRGLPSLCVHHPIVCRAVSSVKGRCTN